MREKRGTWMYLMLESHDVRDYVVRRAEIASSIYNGVSHDAIVRVLIKFWLHAQV